MTVKGFIGYKYKGKIKGWMNEEKSDYAHLGINILEKFKNHTNEELIEFFTQRLTLVVNDTENHYRKNHKKALLENWRELTITVQDNSAFIRNGLECEYSYVLNLDDKTLDVYRGRFEKAQKGRHTYLHRTKQGDKYYNHKVLTVTSKNLEEVELIFTEEKSIPSNIKEDNLYWEEKLIEGLTEEKGKETAKSEKPQENKKEVKDTKDMKNDTKQVKKEVKKPA